MHLGFRPQFDKIVELLLYLAHKVPGADKYQAVKFFYLADKEHLSKYGRPISFDTYYALWYGPVASNVMDLLEKDEYTLSLAGISALPFETEIYTSENGKDIVRLGKPLREYDLDVFSRSDLRVFDEVIATYRQASFSELMKETHSHDAYKKAWGRKGDSKRALMHYDEMIEDASRRGALVEDLSSIAPSIK